MMKNRLLVTSIVAFGMFCNVEGMNNGLPKLNLTPMSTNSVNQFAAVTQFTNSSNVTNLHVNEDQERIRKSFQDLSEKLIDIGITDEKFEQVAENNLDLVSNSIQFDNDSTISEISTDMTAKFEDDGVYGKNTIAKQKATEDCDKLSEDIDKKFEAIEAKNAELEKAGKKAVNVEELNGKIEEAKKAIEKKKADLKEAELKKLAKETEGLVNTMKAKFDENADFGANTIGKLGSVEDRDNLITEKDDADAQKLEYNQGCIEMLKKCLKNLPDVKKEEEERKEEYGKTGFDAIKSQTVTINGVQVELQTLAASEVKYSGHEFKDENEKKDAQKYINELIAKKGAYTEERIKALTERLNKLPDVKKEEEGNK